MIFISPNFPIPEPYPFFGTRFASIKAENDITKLLRVKMKYLVYIMFVFIAMNTWAKESIRIDEPLLDHQDRQLIAKLHDKELTQRVDAAKTLAERHITQATDELIEMLKTDDEHQARITAGLALIEIATPRAIRAVKEQAVRDVNKTVRHALSGMINMLQKDL
ncbi:hypothetical protein GF406_25360 [candidate division KSB1 bacterium]|nr:hypothetical protein [candidate division KSB1 bacterium]